MKKMLHTLPRLYVEAPLEKERVCPLTESQAHYLGRVLRRNAGDAVLLFNGRDGEWRAEIKDIGRKKALLVSLEQTRPPEPAEDIQMLFAPVKRKGTELIIEKLTELGATQLQPVKTARSETERLNLGRLTAISTEAAEQCERLDVPEIKDIQKLEKMLAVWPKDRRLFVCAERGEAQPLLKALDKVEDRVSFLTGPEGGFTEEEFSLLSDYSFVTKVSLGKRILRAETAAIAALSCYRMFKDNL